MNPFTNYILNLKYKNNIGPCNNCKYINSGYRDCSNFFDTRNLDFNLKNKLNINDNNLYRKYLQKQTPNNEIINFLSNLKQKQL